MKYIFGPVPSRRLGLSLGVDLMPKKTCNMNCIYCELGKGAETTNEIKSYTLVDDIIDELKSFIDNPMKQFDCITFTASGEPTLHRDLKTIIKYTKKLTKKPIVILTNSSLIHEDRVFEVLLEVDLLLPSLDAATNEVFKKINRPHPQLKIRQIIDSLKMLKKEMRGQMWLEILFVQGINDTQEELKALKDAIEEIAPDKVQLNTVVRPPAEDFAKPLPKRRLEEIRDFLGNNAEIIIDFKAKMLEGSNIILESEIIDTLKRRPLSTEDFNKLFGDYKKCREIIANLLEKKIVTRKALGEKVYLSID